MKRKACVVVASEMTVRAFLVRQLRAMQADYDVTVVVNCANARLLNDLGVAGTLVPVAIERRLSPWRDLTAAWTLYRLLRTSRFDIVHSMTPKAGLLAMTAAWLARVPVRVHTFTGQVWATRRGPARTMLRMLDTWLARAATFTLADSPSQREFLIDARVVSASKIAVLGSGSVCGVDAARFRPDESARRSVRERLRMSASDIVLLFLGRLSCDKGVLDLAQAFGTVARERRDLRLLIVGPDEAGLRAEIAARCARDADRLHFLDFTDQPEQVIAAADVLCLPSYREGFGSVVIEAAAAGVPAVASRIYGIVDAVDAGRTGLLHQPGDVHELGCQLRCIVADAALRRSLGDAARARAAREFSPERLTTSLLELYSRLIAANPSAGRRTGWYVRFGKRAFDLAVASFALLLLTPCLIVVGMVVRITLGAPIFFRQLRPGLHGAPFVLVKFRSMTDRYDDQERSLPDGERLTRVGRLLRATSLDELPELWNVFKGEMSLVGPRPLLMEYLPRYSPRQALRHAVKPGITGLAQVNGRNSLTWDERFELDLQYVERCSLALDLRILARTVGQVIARRGISQPGHATAQTFMGVEGR